MAADRHTTAFVVGALLGGAAGAAAALWRTPVSGVTLRAMIAERFEGTLFRATGMNEWRLEPPAADPRDLSPPPARSSWDQRLAVDVPSPTNLERLTDPAPASSAMPRTFRGAVVAEKSTPSTGRIE